MSIRREHESMVMREASARIYKKIPIPTTREKTKAVLMKWLDAEISINEALDEIEIIHYRP